MRFEIIGAATDVWSVDQIQAALTAVKAMAVSKRRAFDWANQPHVATFCALDQDEADQITAAARATLDRESSLPALIAHPYS